ncbi:Rv3235 family protein [Arthrobacter sp. JSM 101049]|uniref:Rv3235 family protein n=1 Tax=Arthrobacter sp. JSM 101049 TaxID=929097 RepID=UPI00356856C1
MTEPARPDGQLPDIVPGSGLPRTGDGTLPAVRPLPVRKFADLLPPAARPATHRAPAAEPTPAGPPADQAERREEHAHVHTIVRMVGLAAFESISGVRPVHQLARWLEAGQYEKLRCRVALVAATQPDDGSRLHRNTAIRRTRLCPVGAGAYEASLVVAENDRVRAAALRVERRHGHWTVVELQIG